MINDLSFTDPIFVGGAIYREPAFGQNHPLSISRQGALEDICQSLGWFTEQNYLSSPQASVSTLERYHDAAYIAALKAASQAGKVTPEDREAYHFGTMENPLFPNLFARAATTVGGSIAAAEHALSGGVAFHAAGGTHHGMPDKASGFCYFNDPVFAILTLLEGKMDRVAYIDLDAHHGDGVQHAFHDDHRVRLISVHEENRWPFSGALADRASGNTRNAPVPKGFHDDELAFMMAEMVLPQLAQFAPDAIVVTCGADGLLGDPLSSMALSNVGLQRAVLDLIAQTPRAVILGGGGYNPWTTVRCWAGLWGKVAHYDAVQKLPDGAKKRLHSFSCDLIDDEDILPIWSETLDDPPHGGKVRDAVKAIVAELNKPNSSH